MSTALAIAGVTQVLKDLLNDGIINNNITSVVGTTVDVTSLPPDRIDTAGETTQLNLYMFQATLNQGWRNEGLPTLNAKGERVSNPPLALDLHYLLSAYTSGPPLHTEILLGYGMQLFHENPVLPRGAINRSLNPPLNVDLTALPVTLQALATTGLADQVEQIKITPEIINAEEMSKLWTAFGAKYRPTAAYKVSVVLIQSTQSTKTALPVQHRRIYAIPFHEPVIDEVVSIPGASEPVLFNQLIFSGSTLVLNGTQLKNDNVTVSIGSTDIIPDAGNISDTRISFPLPPVLQAGLQSVQVSHALLMGSPPVLHKGVSSKVQSFVLSPLISVTGNPTGAVNDGLFTGYIELTVHPGIVKKQNVRLLLNALLPGTGSYVFEIQNLDPLHPPETDILIPVDKVAVGIYLVRIQVDGAESPLLTDTATGKYNGPAVTIS